MFRVRKTFSKSSVYEISNLLRISIPRTLGTDHLVDLDQVEDVDFFPIVTIAGESFVTDPIVDSDDVSPNWVFTQEVDSNAGSIPITIDIWDKDAFFAGADDHVDISQGAGRSLVMTLNLATCTISGGVNGDCGQVISSTGLDDDKASIEFQVTSGSIGRFDYCDKHPTSFICKGIQGASKTSSNMLSSRSSH